MIKKKIHCCINYDKIPKLLRKKKKNLLGSYFISLILLISFISNGFETLLKVSNEANSIKLAFENYENNAIYSDVRLNKNILEFKINFPEPQINEIVTPNGAIYTRINIENFSHLMQAGMPSLPFKTLRLLLPFGTEVDNIKMDTGNADVLNLLYKIEPAKEQYPLGSNDTKKDIVEKAIYDSTNPFPEKLYSIEGLYELRGFKIVILNIFPLQYYPKLGTIKYYKELNISINLIEKKIYNSLFRGLNKDIEKIINIVDNPGEVNSYIKDDSIPIPEILELPPGSYDYVIITSNYLKSSSREYNFQDLVEFKNSRGISTVIVTTEEIFESYSGRDNAEKIRNFIIDAYNQWGIEYILLGGDGDGAYIGGETEDPIIPSRGLYCVAGSNRDTNIPSDLYYAALDGNWNDDGDSYWGEKGEEDLLAEVYVGRAPVDSVIELSNFIKKTIEHETSNDPYLTKALMVGEDLGWSVWGSDYKEEIRYSSNNHGYSTVGFSDSYSVATLYDSDSIWSKSDLIELINDNVHVINHLGHANVNYVMKMSNYDIDNSLTNTNYFFGYSQGCYDGSFDNRDSNNNYVNQDSIAEHLVNTPHGAFAFIGNSRYGWGNGDTTDGPSQHFDREFFDAIFGEGISEIGKANQDSKEDTIGFISNDYIRWCYYEINLFGDPTAKISPEPNNKSPILRNQNITPLLGDHETMFNFSVDYYDADNDLPLFINITLNNGINSMMYKKDPFDNNAMDGIKYYYESYLNFGYYKYRFSCSDGVNTNSTVWIAGPEVNPFFNIDPITLLTPIDIILYNGYNVFTWRSLNAPFGNVNFTLQISNSSGFSNILFTLNNIPETELSTSINIIINLEEDTYFWRIRPTYNQFNGTWSNGKSFQILTKLYSDPLLIFTQNLVLMIVVVDLSSIGIVIAKRKIKEKRN